MQFVPKEEFEKVFRKVQSDRKAKGMHVGYWDNFCSISSVKSDDDDYDFDSRTDDEEIRTIYDSRNRNGAPLFGPARKFSEKFFSQD